MQSIRCLLSNFYLNMFRASLCPSSGEQDRVLLYMVSCTGCVGCQPQPAQPVQNTICSSKSPCSDDGHNDARNMLRQKFDNKLLIGCISLVSLSSHYILISLHLDSVQYFISHTIGPTDLFHPSPAAMFRTVEEKLK